MTSEKNERTADNVDQFRRRLTQMAWTTPVIAAITLPAHAQTSATTTAGPGTTAAPTTTPGPSCPDFEVQLSASPTDLVGLARFIFTMVIREVNGVDGTETIYVTVPESTFWNIDSSTGGLNYLGTRGGQHYWEYNAVFPANGTETVTVRATFDPMGETGSEPLVATIVDNSGGDCNVVNNRSGVTLTYEPGGNQA